MNAKKLAALLQKYQDGQCTEEEKHLVEKLYHGFDAEEDPLPGHATMQPHYETLYTNILQQLPVKPVVKATRRPLYIKLAAAAAILVLVAAGIWLLKPVPEAPVLAVKEKKETIRKRFIKLADGSSVLLNAGASLQYPPAFRDAAREVYLSGEAFFDIAPNVEQPFIVHTGKVTTTVLGTAFNIRAIAGDSNVTVTVAKGKVMVDADGKPMGVISANQQISLSTATKAFFRSEEVKLDPVVNWAQEDITFDNATYKDAAEVLHTKFGVLIAFEKEETRHCRFTTTFYNQSSLEDILTVLCAFNQSRFQIRDSIVTISGGDCK